MKRGYLISAISILCLMTGIPCAVYGQTDYILENLTENTFAPPNCPTYTAGYSGDSLSVIYWRIPPVLKPGMSCPVTVKWKLWTNHVPVCYINYFGDWAPSVELGQSSMYGGIPNSNEEFVDNFSFTVPTTPGWYRIRLMFRMDYSPMPNFYGLPGGITFYSEIIFHSGYDVKAEESDAFPSTYGISQNFPNPARVRTTIQYQIPAESNVTIAIYNTAGQVVRTLINGERIKAGNYSIGWDGKNSKWKEVSAGTYFYTLDVNGKMTTKKAIIVE